MPTITQEAPAGVTFPATPAGKRTLTVPGSLVHALRVHHTEQAAERLLVGQLWEDGGYVFAQPTGRPIDPSQDWSDWKALLERAGVRDARLHDARPTAATLLLQQGPRPRGHGHLGALPDQPHAGHLLARRARAGDRGR
jgi:integrase